MGRLLDALSSPVPRWRTLVLTAVHACAVWGCGSGSEEGRAAKPAGAAHAPLGTAALRSPLQQRLPADSAPPTPSAALPARVSRYDMRLRGTSIMYPDMAELEPEHGKGYPVLTVRLLVSNPGRTAREFPSTAACSTASRCDYRSQGGESEPPSHTITISDTSVAQLSAAGGTVAVSPLFLRVPKDTTVTVTLAIDGHAAVARRVKYAASETATVAPVPTSQTATEGASASH